MNYHWRCTCDSPPMIKRLQSNYSRVSLGCICIYLKKRKVADRVLRNDARKQKQCWWGNSDAAPLSSLQIKMSLWFLKKILRELTWAFSGRKVISRDWGYYCVWNKYDMWIFECYRIIGNNCASREGNDRINCSESRTLLHGNKL